MKRVTLPRIKTKYARYRLPVGYSEIHRFGVYALEDIPAKRVVIEHTGERLTWGQASLIRFSKNIYLVELKRGYCVDGRVNGSGAQIANHGCQPNPKGKTVRGRFFLVSRRRIRAGEELTWNYHYPVMLHRVPCNCGARNCRKTLRLILGPFKKLTTDAKHFEKAAC